MLKIIVTLVATALVVCPDGAHANVATRALSCRDGLAVHLYMPQSPEAKVLRMRSGLQLRVSERRLTITSVMVKGAKISEYRERLGRTLGQQGPQLEQPFFWVTLELTRSGQQQLEKALPGPAGVKLVAVCNDTVLTAQLVRQDRIQGVDVLIDENSIETAEEFARSFTPHIRFERRTPPHQ